MHRHMKAIPHHKILPKSGPFLLLKERTMAKHLLLSGEIRKGEKVRDEPSHQKGIKGYLRCMVSANRSTHPLSFIWRAGYHTNLGYTRRCQLLLQAVRQAKGVPYVGCVGFESRYISNCSCKLHYINRGVMLAFQASGPYLQS